MTEAEAASGLCAVCREHRAIYTCPRCAIKSCSATCVASHKTLSGCTGQRDRVAFVPMNEYGFGAMANDYVFLEDVGRHVEAWGRDIARGGLLKRPDGAQSMRGARGRGRGRGRTYGHGQDKRSYLSMHLGFRDVDMDVLPAGMERTKRNQSYWDSK